MSLAGRTLLMSGGSRGIGLAIAVAAARRGADVVLLAKTDTPDPRLSGTIHTAAAEIEAAGTVVMLPRLEPSPVIETMLAESVTVFAGVPTMHWGLLGALEEGTDVETLAKNLRMAIAGGSALPVEVHREVEKRFGV